MPCRSALDAQAAARYQEQEEKGCLTFPQRSAPSRVGAYFESYLETMGRKMAAIGTGDLARCAERVVETSAAGGKLIIVGNGGSAAIASHVSVDFAKTAGVRAMNFNEADLITCFANDYGYPHWVEKALHVYADRADLVVLISSSGCSLNIVNAARQARAMGLGIVTLTGFNADNPVRQLGDINLWVDSSAYNVVEMAHHVWLLAIVDYLVSHKNP